MDTQRPPRVKSAAVFVGAALLLFVGMHPALSLYDEGVVLVGAERVMRGEVPYRDFWTLYAPGQFYVVSWLFGLFGVSDLVLRMYGIVIKALIVLLAWLLMGRFARPAAALGGAFAVLLLLTGAHNYGFPVFPALALSLAALTLLADAYRIRTRFWLMAACIATTVLFRQDLGAYAALAIAVGYACEPGQRLSGARRLRRMAGFLAAVALLLAPFALWLLWSVPSADLFAQLVEFPLRQYPITRALPFPLTLSTPEGHAWFHPATLSRFAVYAPFVVSVWALLLCYRRQRSGDAVERGGTVGVGVALVAMNLLFTLKGLVRVEPLHMMQSLVLSTVIIAMVVSRDDLSRPRRRWPVASAGLIAALMLPSAAFGGWAITKSVIELASEENNLLVRCLRPQLPRLRCAAVDEDTLNAVQYVQRHTSADDAIYVGTYRHDRIVANAVALYFVAERRPFTRWHELHPGLQTGAVVQQSMLDEIDRQPPRLVVLTALGASSNEPNESSRSSGVRLIDAALDAQYVETTRFGENLILQKRNDPSRP